MMIIRLKVGHYDEISKKQIITMQRSPLIIQIKCFVSYNVSKWLMFRNHESSSRIFNKCRQSFNVTSDDGRRSRRRGIVKYSVGEGTKE